MTNLFDLKKHSPVLTMGNPAKYKTCYQHQHQQESLNFSIKKCKLHYFKVNVVHITATSKNAADDKIRQSLRRFSDTHSPPATVVLVSCKYRGDIKCWYFFICSWEEWESWRFKYFNISFMYIVVLIIEGCLVLNRKDFFFSWR